eukprot:scaffold12163_cov176-Amphora_coffeaeformis.AAC.23
MHVVKYACPLDEYKTIIRFRNEIRIYFMIFLTRVIQRSSWRSMPWYPFRIFRNVSSADDERGQAIDNETRVIFRRNRDR